MAISKAKRDKKENKGLVTSSKRMASGASFDDRQLQMKGIQLLESLELIGSSKKLDTLSGRYLFVVEMYDLFIVSSKKDRYQYNVQVALDEYKLRYYDKVVTDNQVSLILFPCYSELQKYASDSILRCYKEYITHQEKEIEALKTVAAKNRRYENLVKTGSDAIHMFEVFKLPDNGQCSIIKKLLIEKEALKK